MTKRGRPTTANIEAIQAAAKMGLTQAEAASLYDVSISTVCKYWPISNTMGRPSKHQEIEALLRAGDTVGSIAEALKVSESTVRRVRRNMKPSAEA